MAREALYSQTSITLVILAPKLYQSINNSFYLEVFNQYKLSIEYRGNSCIHRNEMNDVQNRVAPSFPN